MKNLTKHNDFKINLKKKGLLSNVHLTLIYFTLASLFFACTSENAKSDGENPKLANLTETQIADIGKLHNDFLDQALENIDYQQTTSKNFTQMAQNAILNIDIEELDKSQKQSLISFQLNNDINVYDMVSDNCASYLGMIEEKIIEYKNLKELILSFEQIKVNAKSELSEHEYKLVSLTMSVGMNSAEFWSPVEQGGTGKGYAFFKYRESIFGNTTMGNKLGDCWKQVVLHDLFGALTGAIGWGLGLAIVGGPVTLASYLVALGYGAATASISNYCHEA